MKKNKRNKESKKACRKETEERVIKGKWKKKENGKERNSASMKKRKKRLMIERKNEEREIKERK